MERAKKKHKFVNHIANIVFNIVVFFCILVECIGTERKSTVAGELKTLVRQDRPPVVHSKRNESSSKRI